MFVFLWGYPEVKAWLGNLHVTAWKSGLAFRPTFEWPGLHNLVMRAPPVVAKPVMEGAVYSVNVLAATGTSLLLTGIVSGLLLKLSPLQLVRTYLAMLALGFTTRYSGSDATMGLAFASTGALFPFFSPMLGWLGVALTGSDTSSNVLFGGLQVVSAQQIGMSPLLAAASNRAGGVMGTMIDAQSIVVAGVATNQEGHEGEILRYVFWHSLVLAALVGVLVFAQAHWLGWMIPH